MSFVEDGHEAELIAAVEAEEAAPTFTSREEFHAACPDELVQLIQATDALSCPWFRGVGFCDSGCDTEPSCQTGEPSGGWFRQAREAVDALEKAAQS